MNNLLSPARRSGHRFSQAPFPPKTNSRGFGVSTRPNPASSFLALVYMFMVLVPVMAAVPAVRIDVKADKALFRLSELMIGANMEDLHYQMCGGFYSQLIHGEHFFEPSESQLAPKISVVRGFQHCFVQSWLPSSENVTGRVTVEHGVVSLTGKGIRLTSDQPSQAVETGVEINFPAGVSDNAGLIVCVSSLNSDNGWPWYSGFTVELNPKDQRIQLLKAKRANQHREVARADLKIEAEQWIQVSTRLDGNNLKVLVNGREMIHYKNEIPLVPAHYGLVAKQDAKFRALWEKTEGGVRRDIALVENPLIKAPGDAISLRWSKVRTGTAKGGFALETTGTWLAGCQSQTIRYESGEGELGIDNAGLKRWGIAVKDGQPYEGFIRIKSEQPADVHVSMRSADGSRIHASQVLKVAGVAGAYQKIPFTLTPSGRDDDGRFAITLRKPGTITLGYVFLQPGEEGRYHGLPVRKDLAEALLAQGVRLLRFNGGMIEVEDYRWKNMQGPRDQRPPYGGFYDKYCGNGFGVIEIVQFASAAGIAVAPGLNLDETPEDVADFIAYCNAPESTPAGRRRAADGHPKPYGLKYYQVANESHVNRRYVDKFKQVAEAIWKVDPDITLLTTGNAYGLKPGEKAEDVRRKLALHLELTQFMHRNGKKLLWDCHVYNKADDPAQALSGQVPGAIEFSRWLTKLDPSLGVVPVGLLEFNAGRFDHGRGLAHAIEMNVTHRAGDVMHAVGMPNVSQPWGVYQTDWKAVLWTQGNIYYTPAKVWFQAAYYVDQMIDRNWAPDVVQSEVAGPDRTLDVIAARTVDGRGLVLRVVNLKAEPVRADISVGGFVPALPMAVVEELAGEPAAYNTLEEPEKIKPVRKEWQHQANDGKMNYTFAGNSFTVISIK